MDGSPGDSTSATALLRVACPEGYKYHALRLLGALRWVIQQRLHYNYLLKTDDDTYVCPSSLVARLYRAPRSHLYFGKMVVGRRSNWTASSRWHDPRYGTLFPGYNGTYATYAAGSLYILSSDVAARADTAALALPIGPESVPAFEDAMIGALLASSTNGDARESLDVVDVGNAVREYPSAHWIPDFPQFKALKRRRALDENTRACRSRRYLALHALPAPALRQCALLAGPHCT
jgi:hypothetical protein